MAHSGACARIGKNASTQARAGRRRSDPVPRTATLNRIQMHRAKRHHAVISSPCMPNPQINPGQSAVVGISGQGTGGTVLPLGSLSVSIDNYAAAFVAKIQPDNNAQAYYNLVPKSVPAGTTVTVTVTLSGTNQAGVALPSVTQQFDLIGAALPPQDTAIVPSAPNISTQFATSSTDPGTATVQLI
jgi:hypothetical protein